MSVVVNSRATSGFYGLVKQRGPWKETKADKQSVGSGAGFSTAHAGHQPMQMMNPYQQNGAKPHPKLSVIAQRKVIERFEPYDVKPAPLKRVKKWGRRREKFNRLLGRNLASTYGGAEGGFHNDRPEGEDDVNPGSFKEVGNINYVKKEDAEVQAGTFSRDHASQTELAHESGNSAVGDTETVYTQTPGVGTRTRRKDVGTTDAAMQTKDSVVLTPKDFEFYDTLLDKNLGLMHENANLTEAGKQVYEALHDAEENMLKMGNDYQEKLRVMGEKVHEAEAAKELGFGQLKAIFSEVITHPDTFGLDKDTVNGLLNSTSFSTQEIMQELYGLIQEKKFKMSPIHQVETVKKSELYGAAYGFHQGISSTARTATTAESFSRRRYAGTLEQQAIELARRGGGGDDFGDDVMPIASRNKFGLRVDTANVPESRQGSYKKGRNEELGGASPSGDRPGHGNKFKALGPTRGKNVVAGTKSYMRKRLGKGMTEQQAQALKAALR